MPDSTKIHLPFPDRREAGRLLAERLLAYRGRKDTLVLGLARGGVPAAFEVAQKLRVPLDVFVVRKLGVPGDEELAMGAIASGGVRVLNKAVLSRLVHGDDVLAQVTARETRELLRREQEYRNGRAASEVKGKTVILVDDGLATGATMRAAVTALQQYQVACCMVAVPVGAADSCRDLQKQADEVICLTTPEPFYGVGQFYKNFPQVSDEEVRELLSAIRVE